jgi:hypothetical protein
MTTMNLLVMSSASGSEGVALTEPVNCWVLFHGADTATALRKRRVTTIDRPRYINIKNPFTFTPVFH